MKNRKYHQYRGIMKKKYVPSHEREGFDESKVIKMKPGGTELGHRNRADRVTRRQWKKRD